MFFDNEDMLLIKGQDHCYWIYSNKRDMYIPTNYSYHFFSEEDIINILNMYNEEFYEPLWRRYDNIDI